jgi:hypothetical protein
MCVAVLESAGGIRLGAMSGLFGWRDDSVGRNFIQWVDAYYSSAKRRH